MATNQSHRKTILVVSQVFIPDPASVGQHMADVALELARRGHERGAYNVRVYASARGYENPAAVYPTRQTIGHADIRRLPFASFGKKSMGRRVIGTAVFMVQAFFAALFTPRLAGIFFSTSPPLIGLPMCIVAVLRRVPVAYWAMDLNPDQLIALGKLRKSDWTCRILESVNRFILGRCALIVALDRFMAARLRRRRVSPKKMLVMPPWPHEDQFTDAPDANENPFRIQHNLVGKFVFMYSGNHSPSNPLTTILQAAVRLGDDNNIRFVFVGGGSGKQQVEDYVRGHTLKNALSLPYQPLAELKNSLAAADVHIVSLGEPMVGIIHPCKIYGAMAIGRPILFLGPSPSHISDLMEQHKIGIRIDHGDVNGAVQALQKFREMPPAQLTKMAKTAQVVLTESLSQTHLTRQFCNAVEKALGLETV